jgi:hypothetical protein
MSDKKRRKHRRHRRLNPRFVGLVCTAAALLVGVILWITLAGKTPDDQGTATGEFVPMGTIKIENLQDSDSETYKNLTVTKIGKYSGIFVEDGSDGPVAGILMVVVKNTGKQTVQYGEVELTDGENTAFFTLSTLPPGESVVLLEKNRMSYDAGKALTQVTIKNVAVFQEEPSLHEELLKIQALDGALNVTNISGEDITGDVVIYYKNASSDLLYGGITYRVTIKGGIKAGEVKQITAAHYTAKGSRVMWITVE